MTSSLVGSEMCIRDRFCDLLNGRPPARLIGGPAYGTPVLRHEVGGRGTVSYTHLTLPTICSV
eukprot:11942985-Prorocentrum_lima.AAC.1